MSATPREDIKREVIACLDDLPDSGHASLTIHVTRMKDGAVIVEHHQKKAPRVLRFGNNAQRT